MIACLEHLTPGPVIAGDDPATSALMVAWRDHADEAAAQKLVSQMTPLVRGIASRVLPRPWMVDDAVQNTLAKMFRSLEHFDQRIPLSAWTVCIAKNTCSNILRSWRRRAVFCAAEMGLDDAQDAEHADHSLSLCDTIMAREDLQALFCRIADMAAKDRQIVSLLFMDGCSATDAARTTGMSPGAVRVRAFRIRSALRECIGRSNSRHLNASLPA